MKRFSLTSLFLLSTLAVCQGQPLPTIQECRVDYVAFGGSNTETFEDKVVRLTFQELVARENEMYDCDLVANAQHPRDRIPMEDIVEGRQFADLGRLYKVVSTNRMISYMKRHSQWGNFKDEDAAGQR